jgi:alpha-D-ribose 1-methylphosphonate 5-triphosphate synthase subunit PhnH
MRRTIRETNDMSDLCAGFKHEANSSQAVSRAALQALSLSGRAVHVAPDAQSPGVGHAASAALHLALLDADCSLWLSPSLCRSDAGAWLRFHTGCQLVDATNMAQFAWVAFGDTLPPLFDFAQGSDLYPDTSCTCIVDVVQFDCSNRGCPDWRPTGPGSYWATLTPASKCSLELQGGVY